MARSPRKLDPARIAADHGRVPATLEPARPGLFGLPEPAEAADLQLGPLEFAAPIGNVAEAVGDGLEAVGAAIVTAERRPRSVKLQLPVRGLAIATDPKPEGERLRRQLRQLMNNAKLRLQGFYLLWEQDPELDGWLLVGTGELAETDPGISFGEFQLELGEVFRRGYPGTHRPGRRIRIGDRRTGQVPRDTRRSLYSTDFATTGINPLAVLPGSIQNITRSSGEPIGGGSVGYSPTGPYEWQSFGPSADGEVWGFDPDLTTVALQGRDAYLLLEDIGSVRVWDLAGAATYPPATSGYSTASDLDPTKYGWERVYGPLLKDTPVAIDNGACRLIWLGATGTTGLAYEHYDTATKKYVRQGRILFHVEAGEGARVNIIELTMERAVVEWRLGQFSLRAILQRGWHGPRVESYSDGTEPAVLEYVPHSAANEASSTTAKAEEEAVWKLSGTGGSDPPIFWAQGTNDEVKSGAVYGKSEDGTKSGGFRFKRNDVIVAQLGNPTAQTVPQVAGLSLVDVQAIPVLLDR